MTPAPDPVNEIRIISASAGSGKTYRLADELAKSIASGDVRPEAVVAVTFTNKAAGELFHRVRAHLLANGQPVAAQRLAAARIGTVHSVCSRLVSDYAFDRGLPPHLEILDEIVAASTLERMLASVLEDDDVADLPDVRSRLAAWAKDGDTWDYQLDVRRVVDAARSNRIQASQLAGFAKRSWETLQPLLGTPVKDGAAIERDLVNALKSYLDAVPDDVERPVAAKRTRRKAETACRRLRRGRSIAWATWATLGSAESGAAWRDAIKPVNDAAKRHCEHPRLHEDVRRGIEIVFTLAASVLHRYQEEKEARGVVDFVDQEAFALDLLGQREVRDRLRGEIDLVLVDEFQDTSPIQLAIFLALARIAPRNVWVGDQKQSIFAFRGTDPTLMDAAIDGILGSEEPETLPKSWRSRPELVELTSDLFAPAFADQNIPESRVRLVPAHRKYPAGLGTIAEIWPLETRNVDQDAAAIASALRQCLDDPEVTVRDPVDGTVRRAQPGDIAVLCKKNLTCGRIAAALEAAGIRTALPLQGLLETSEARLILAALRLWADPRDALAAAELARLVEFPDDDEAWLARIVDTPGSDAFADVEVVRTIVRTRTERPLFGLLEIVDAVIELTAARDVCRRWGNGGVRHGNLERLRGRAVTYAQKQAGQGVGATVTGFLAALRAPLPRDVVVRETEAVADERAVTVSTWHAAKGLEWPITILFELTDRDDDKAALGVRVVSDRKRIDLETPLAGRWIRYWPNPYGRASREVPLLGNLLAHPATGAAMLAHDRESLRLLYVGWTRARDRIILAARAGTLTSGTLKKLDIVEPEGGDATVTWADREVEITVRPACGDAAVATAAPEPDLGYAPGERRRHPPAVLLASDAVIDDPEHAAVQVGDPVDLGPRIAISGTPDWAHLGDAIHGFLAADRPGVLDDDARRRIGQRLLEAWGVAGVIAVDDLLAAGARFDDWIDTTWPGATRRRELPMTARDPATGTITRGIADLILETADGEIVVIDHKSFPGTEEQALAKAAGFAGQLDAYATMTAAALDAPVVATMVHMPVVGVVVPVLRRAGATTA